MALENPRSTPDALPGWTLPEASARILARVAKVPVPVLCLESHGPAFARAVAAIHRTSGRDRLVRVDLADAGRDLGDLLTSPPVNVTLAIDRVHLADGALQQAIARALDGPEIRLICATTLGLDELRRACSPEFFALISTVTVSAPALGRLGADLARVIEARLADIARALGRAAPRLGASAITALLQHSWPGDAHELDAVLLRTLLGAGDGPLEAADLHWSPLLDGSDRVTLEAARGIADPAESTRPGRDRVDDRPSPSRPEIAAGRNSQRSAALDLAPSEGIALELAHQIKNPLVAVKIFVQSLGAAPETPPDLTLLCEETDRAVRRIDDAVEEMLAFSRLGAPRTGDIDVVEVLRDTLRETWPDFASKEVTLTGPNGASLVVQGDDEHLRQALATLTRHLLDSIEPASALEIAIVPPREIVLRYREWGALTHLRGLGGVDPQGLPLAMLLARSALERTGSTLEVRHSEGGVEVALRFPTG